MMHIVKQEKRNAFSPNALNAAVTIRPLIIKITTPIFTEKASDINWCNRQSQLNIFCSLVLNTF